ncbi:MAG TPA: VanZ family protein [Chromatiales bacterium]|nr:VanZ family protein [Chromatiales bacterium]
MRGSISERPTRWKPVGCGSSMRFELRRRVLRHFQWWYRVGWGLVVAVIVGSLVPSIPTAGIPLSDKIMHFTAYGVLMLWFSQLYLGWSRIPVALLLVALGLVMEVCQGLTGYRQYDPVDMLANSIGVGLGLALGLTPLATALSWVERRFLLNNPGPR